VCTIGTAFKVKKEIPAKVSLRFSLTLFTLSIPMLGAAQSDQQTIAPILEQPIQSREVATFQLQQFLLKKSPQLPTPSSAQQWTGQSDHIRQKLLNDVVFHGWPREWINSSPRFEDLGRIPSGEGYQIHKLRYEVVPGFYATALLYEPERITGKMPAILHVMGHFYERGNTEEFAQTLCINLALRGIIVLNPNWIGIGELNVPGNDHWFGAHLDLVGMNGIGLFYLAMRRCLDYLANDPNVDTSRIGMTGLSGGGWQTIILSSLDPRILVPVPVAGYTSLPGRVERFPSEAGDLEQNATDLLVGQDYSTLTAMLAPRPTLLIYNAEDDCCFRAPLVKPYVYEAIQPFFHLYGKDKTFLFHQDTTISAHNYGPANREAAYLFFDEQFHLAASDFEMPVAQSLKNYDELRVGVPEDNLTILSLARKRADEINRSEVPNRNVLSDVLRYDPVTVEHAWLQANTCHNQVESISYRFEFTNGLGAVGVWLKHLDTKSNARLTIVLNDEGKSKAANELLNRVPLVADRLARGEQVLVLDLLFTGDAAPNNPPLFAEMLAATGERPLGMEAAQLIGIGKWAHARLDPEAIRIESNGIRSQVICLTASNLAPHLFSAISIHGGMHSFAYLLDEPIHYDAAPDLFCLDLYKDYDIGQLELLASPTRVSSDHYVETRSVYEKTQ
jgi:dienelactone hydrolase